MPRLLHLDSSADPVASASRVVTAQFAHAWRSLGDDHTVTCAVGSNEESRRRAGSTRDDG